MNNTFTGVIAVVILVVLVGFGVWYFTTHQTPEEKPAIQLNVGGSFSGNNP